MFSKFRTYPYFWKSLYKKAFNRTCKYDQKVKQDDSIPWYRILGPASSTSISLPRGRIGVAAVVAALSAAVVDPPNSLHYLHRITSNYVQLVPACPLFCYRFSFKLSLLLICLR
jgi:hypothetical protein